MDRNFVFWIILAATRLQAAEPQPLEMYQIVIRAPEMEVLALVRDPAVTDAMLTRHLRQAALEGRARILADVTGAVDDLQSAEFTTGHRVWLPTELDQEFDHLFMTPTAYQEFLIGTSVTCRPEIAIAPDKSIARINADWITRLSPREPLTVQWPTSWLRIRENDEPTDRAIHGWLDWRDLFEEKVSGGISFAPGMPKLIAILPPAEQVWPGEGAKMERQLDVLLAGIGPPGRGSPLDPKERTLLLGIALDSGEALKIMAARDPANDAVLLESLLEKVRAGAARMILSAASGGGSPGSRTLSSARIHSFPTEMPSIPSAWDERFVGTYWEKEDGVVALRQDLAPPARSEWKLALDYPSAVMWEPRFRGLSIRATHARNSGTYLLSLLHVPEVMRSPDMAADESLLIFAEQHAAAHVSAPAPAGSDPFSPAGDAAWPEEVEAEILIFQVPAREEAAWQLAAFAAPQESDQVRLQTLLRRVQAGSASLAGHLLVRAPLGQSATCRIAEDYMTATEFDPPELANSPRMRPTALETLPVGSRWEIDVTARDNGLVVNHTLEHSTSKPVEPPLSEALAVFARGSHDHPGADHHQVTWKGSVVLAPGLPLCLGIQDPPGAAREVRHVAFLRVRKLPAPPP